jgi:hypothetical protein
MDFQNGKPLSLVLKNFDFAQTSSLTVIEEETLPARKLIVHNEYKVTGSLIESFASRIVPVKSGFR